MADSIKNDIKKLMSLREKCDKEISRLQKEARARELSENNFGFIKENFEALAPHLFKSKGGRSVIKEYINTIKESRELAKMHLFYECIRKAPKNCDILDYINESKKLICGEIDKSKMAKALPKLRKVYEKAYVMADNPNAITENSKLNEAIEYILTEKKTGMNLPIFSLNMQTIKEFIENNGVEYKEKDGDIDINNLVAEFTNKFDDLSEEDINVLKEICADDAEEVFNKYKNECLKKIDEKKSVFAKQGDIESCEKLNTICEKVAAKDYNPATLSGDICNLFGITRCITD